MNQETIITGLLHALNNGQGGLDDLAELLNKAQKDIDQAKAEEAARKEAERRAAEEARKKKAQACADLATRTLNDKATAEDVAMVLNAFCVANGMPQVATADMVNAIMNDDKGDDSDIPENLRKGIDAFLSALCELVVDACLTEEKKVATDDPDMKLDNFLKNLGIR